MADLVLFPDTDALARTLLRQELAGRGVTGIGVATAVPHPPPDRFIRLFTLPGREVCRRTQWVQVIAQVYDVSGQDVRCSQLAQLVAAILRSAPDVVVAGGQLISEPCEKHGPYPSPDPDLPGRPRYQANITWTVQSESVSTAT